MGLIERLRVRFQGSQPSQSPAAPDSVSAKDREVDAALEQLDTIISELAEVRDVIGARVREKRSASGGHPVIGGDARA